ncbi:nuclear transport factor 2 family protein [Nocardia rhizosphaerihabitans]|uniref:nuclear transport factor 2 family protein n=1 Tax=Nocardia rhizosphaerihabitans TaxID=1691570 RepID=UPI0036717F40
MPDNTITTEDLIRATERSRLAALVEADIATAAIHHGTEFQLITPIGAALNRDEYLGAVGDGHIDYLVWEPGPISVRLHGDAACLRYQADLEVVFGGHPLPRARYWHTDLYEFLDGRWQVVWSQATQIR